MDKKYFSFRLFKDAVKQLRMIGAASFIIICFTGISGPVSSILTYKSWENMYGESMNGGASFVSLINQNFLLFLLFIIVAPLMVLFIFSFMNKRNTSDFYHALPQTRLCIFTSFFAAVVVWITVILVVSATATLCIVSAFPQYYMVDWAASLTTAFNLWAASLLVAGSVAMAMSITGTLFTNVIVSGLIIFLPRILIKVLTRMMVSILPILTSHSILPFLEDDYNVVTGTVFAIFLNETSIFNSVLNLPGGIYTLCLAVLYIAAAALLFHRRSSEAAEYAAPSRKLQMVYRLIIAMVVCLVPCQMIVDATFNGYAVSLFSLFCWYVAAVGAFFLYELLSTRQIKNLVKAVPSLGILVLMNVVLIAGIAGGVYMSKQVQPDADDIQYVRLIKETEWEGDKSYFTIKAGEIRLDSDEVKEVVADQLRNTVAELDADRDTFYYNMRNTTDQCIAVKVGAVTYYRQIWFSHEAWQVLVEEIQKSDEFRSVYLDLPEDDSAIALSMQNVELEQDAVKRVYSILQEEIQEMDFYDWYTLVQEGSGYYENDLVESIYFSVPLNGTSYATQLPITTSMKKTLRAYLSEMENMNYNDKIRDQLAGLESGTTFELSLRMHPGGSNPEEEFMYGYFGSEIDIDGNEQITEVSREAIAAIIGWTEQTQLREIDFDQPYAALRLEVTTVDENGYYSYQNYNSYFQTSVNDLPESVRTELW